MSDPVARTFLLVDTTVPLDEGLAGDNVGCLLRGVERDDIAWSNELALHVVEFKTNGPARGFGGLVDRFQANVDEATGLLVEPGDASGAAAGADGRRATGRGPTARPVVPPTTAPRSRWRFSATLPRAEVV